jgi:large subunit ribosomal protein L25
MTKTTHQINAQVRDIVGSKVKQIRRQGLVPATVYGKGMESISVQFNALELEKIFSETGESVLVELLLDGNKLPILFKNPQYHYINSNLIHIDCYKVNLKEKITAEVPIVLVGESPAVKEGNVLIEVSDTIEVEALPADLPENIEIDISTLLAVDDYINAGMLKIDKTKVELKTNEDQIIVKIDAQRVEEEIPSEEVVAPGDVPATEQKTPEEENATEGKKEEN